MSDGAVSFLATTTDGGGGVYTTLGGFLTEVIGEGDIVDGIVRGNFGTYGHGIDGDLIVFNAGLESGGAENNTNFVARPVDSTPPALRLSVSPEVLWPPNHKMIPIDVTVTAEDTRDPTPTIELVLLQSSEGDTSDTFDPAFDVTEVVGKKGDDIQLIDGQLFLRAERAGKGDGRVYTITYRATDASGNSTTDTATVEVPHNQ